MNIYRKSWVLSATVLIISLSLQPVAAIQIGLDRLLGTVEPGTPANEANELQMLNFLIGGYNTGLANGTVHALGNNPSDPGPEANFLNVSATTDVPAPLLPTLPVGDWTAGGGNNHTVSQGGDTHGWISAKYGNRTSFFYIGDLGGADITLPVLSRNPNASQELASDYFQGAGNGNGYGLSHSTFFGGGGSTTVPDGGTTLALLGVSLLGLGGLRKFATSKKA